MPCVSGMFFDSDPPWPITQLHSSVSSSVSSPRSAPCAPSRASGCIHSAHSRAPPCPWRVARLSGGRGLSFSPPRGPQPLSDTWRTRSTVEGTWCLWASGPHLTEGPLASSDTFGTSAVSESWRQGQEPPACRRLCSWGSGHLPGDSICPLKVAWGHLHGLDCACEMPPMCTFPRNVATAVAAFLGFADRQAPRAVATLASCPLRLSRFACEGGFPPWGSGRPFRAWGPERRSVFQARRGGPPEPPLAGGVLLRGLQHLHACPEPLETGESRRAGRARGCQHTRWRCSDSPVGRSPCRCTVRSVVSGPREAAAQTFSRGAETTPSADRGNWRFLGQDGFTDGGKCPVLGSGCWALGAGHPLTLKTRSLTTCRQPWRVSHPPPLGSDKCPRHWVSWGLPFPGAAGLVATFLQVTRGKRAPPECPSPSRAAHGVLARGQEE